MSKGKSKIIRSLLNLPTRVLKRVARRILQLGEVTPYITINISSLEDRLKLHNKNIVVTGGSKGLGFAMAKKFISQGANVIITGRNKIDLDNATSVLGINCKSIVSDVSNVDESKTFIEQCFQLFGGTIDCLVCNAGVSLHECDFTDVSIEGFDTQFNINFRGTFFLSKAFLEYQRSKKIENASLLIISSETSNMAYDIPYGMTKAALNSMVAALSRRVYKEGIRVNAIAPGVTLSEMTASYAKSEDGNLYRKNAANRVFLPEEVAEVAAFILSDASVCISGEVIHTNAGNHHRVFWE